MGEGLGGQGASRAFGCEFLGTDRARRDPCPRWRRSQNTASAWRMRWPESVPPPFPELIRALEDPIVRGPAVAGIETMEHRLRLRLFPALTVLLKDPNPGMRSIALRALAAIGEEATEAGFPALMVALDDPVGYVRVGAAETLAAIGPGSCRRCARELWAMAQNSNLDRQLRLNCDIAVRRIQGRK